MNKLLRNVPVHDGSKFYWHMRVGSADASELGAVISTRLYADAADVGFIVRSHRTGHTKLFSYVGNETVAGEVVTWTYAASDGARIIIHND